MKTLDDLFQIIEKGGAGSGNIGHSGRPGKHGGSAPKGSGGGSSGMNAEMQNFINTFELDEKNKNLLDSRSHLKSQLNRKGLRPNQRHELQGRLFKVDKDIIDMQAKIKEARKLVSPFKGQYEKVREGEFSHPEGGTILVGFSSGSAMHKVSPSASIKIILGSTQHAKRWYGATARDSSKKYLKDKFGI